MITTLTGTNDYALKQVLKQRTQTFIETEGNDMGLEQLDGDEASIERISEALTSLPFLSNKKMVILRQASRNKQFSDQAETLLSDVPDTTDVLIIEPKLDKRSNYFKYLKRATDYQEFAELDQHGLVRWLCTEATASGGSLNQRDATLLVQRVGANQQLVASELQKLLLHAPNITTKSIEQLTEATPQSTIFELLDAAFAGKTRRAIQLYTEQRALKVEPQQIIAMMAWQLHVVALIKAAGTRTVEAIASEAKISPYTVKKSQTIARQLSMPQLRRLVSELVTLDQRSKRETFSIDDALQHYILILAQ